MTLAQAKAETLYPESHRSTEPSRRPRKRREVDPAVYVSALALIVLVASMGHVAQRAKLATLTYELHREKARLAELERVQTHLLVEVERARSLSRVEADARSRLGMVKPDTVTWVVVEPAAPSHEVRLAGAGDRRGRVWLSAVSDWFHRVRSEIQAALPFNLREPGR